jgi:NAD(P)-dependent dehydrogenase (short-subunit alcohol dehydrogenase family)
MSKAAVNIAGVNLAHDLRSRGVAVLLLHPGYVRTEMTRGRGDKDAATAARELAALMDRLGMSDTGTFWHAEGYALPW